MNLVSCSCVQRSLNGIASDYSNKIHNCQFRNGFKSSPVFFLGVQLLKSPQVIRFSANLAVALLLFGYTFQKHTKINEPTYILHITKTNSRSRVVIAGAMTFS